MKKASAPKKWAKGRRKNGESRIGISANGLQASAQDDLATTVIEDLLAEERWSRARSLILRELRKSPTSHWLLTMLGLTHYEQREYEKALAYSKKALRLKPGCPLVLAHYAGTLAMLGEAKKALQVYRRLVARDVESVAYDECGEGMDWALELLNDCQYRMGRCYQSLGNNAAARRSFKKYLHNRAHGVRSIHDQRKAEAFLAEVSEKTAV